MKVPFTTLVMVDLAVPLPPVVSEVQQTSVIVTGVRDPAFDSSTSGTCVRVFDAATDEQVLINGSATVQCDVAGGAPEGVARGWPRKALQPGHEYYAVTEYYDIYDRHPYSDPDLVKHEDPSIALRAIDKLIAHAHRFNRALDIAVTDQPSDDQAGAA